MTRTDLEVGEPAPHNAKLHEAIDNLKHLLEPHNNEQHKFLDNEGARTSLSELVQKARKALGTHDDTSEGTSDDTSETSDSDRGLDKKRYKVAWKVGKKLGRRALKKEAGLKWKALKASVLKGTDTVVESWDSVNAKLKEAKRQFKADWKETKRKARESQESVKQKIEDTGNAILNNTGL